MGRRSEDNGPTKAREPLELAAIRALARLQKEQGIAFVSSHGVTSLAGGLMRFLLRAEPERRSLATAEWLIEQPEVADLFVSDEELERILALEWDGALLRAKAEVQEATPAYHERFEAQLMERPDDPQLAMVYGDWLEGQGDPLGGLIARQLAAESGQAGLQAEVTKYLQKHRRYFFGRLAEYVPRLIKLEWRRGFVRAARVGALKHSQSEYQGAVLLRWLLELRITRLMTGLELRAFGRDQREQQREMAEALFERERPLLRRVLIIDPDARMYTEPIDLSPAVKALPALEHLEVRARSVRLRLSRRSGQQASFPMLKRLSLEVQEAADVHDVSAEEHLGALAAMSWPRLRHLCLSTRGFNQNAARRQLTQLLDPRVLPKLRALRIFAPDDDVVEILARSRLVEQLRTLELYDGQLSSEAAQEIALCAQRFSNLSSLDLRRNRIDARAAALVGRVCPQVLLEGQQPQKTADALDAGF